MYLPLYYNLNMGRSRSGVTRELRFKQVDVFTEAPFKGNPVAVVFDADGLSVDEMTAVASWTNLSETTFVQTSDRGDYRLRIFSKKRELPFAGHPTIGSAHAIAEEGLLGSRMAWVQDCFAGLIPITLDRQRCIFALAPAAKIRPRTISSQDLGAIVSGVSLTEAVVVDIGAVWMVARVLKGDMFSLVYDAPALASLSRELGCSGLTVYRIDEPGGVEVRSFAPAAGVPEDPVCGSGNVAVAAHLRLTGVKKRVGLEYLARQGKALGRDGQVFVKFRGQDILIGGRAVTCIDGIIRLPEREQSNDIRRTQYEPRQAAG